MKKICINLLILFFVFGIHSCKSQKEDISIINFKKEKTNTIIPEKSMNFYSSSYKEKKDSVFITLYNDEKRNLITYDLFTGKINESISVDFFKYQRLMAFNYYNKDSIFLAFSTATSSLQNGHNRDSALLLINNKGEINEVLNFKNLPVRCSYNPVLPQESTIIIPGVLSDIYYSNKKLFFSTMKLYHFAGDSICESNNLPLAGHYDFTNSRATLYKEINKLPFFKKGRFYNRLYSITRVSLSDDNLPLIFFAHTPLIYKYDYNSGIKYQYKIKSLLVDTIKPGYDREYVNKVVDVYKHSYLSIYYDKYRNLYYRFVGLAAKKDDSPYRKNHRKKSMIVADTSFNVIAEGILPENLSVNNLIISKEGLWFYNSTDKENITFELYSLDFKKGTKKDLVTKYNEKAEFDLKVGILSYMEDLFKIKKENSAIVFVPSDLGCRSCASTISKFYVDNQNLFKDKNLYFVVAGLSKFTVDPFLVQNELKEGMPNLCIDKKGEYLNYLEGFNNPKLFIIEKGKLKFEKVYKPAELIELEMKIKEYSENN